MSSSGHCPDPPGARAHTERSDSAERGGDEPGSTAADRQDGVPGRLVSDAAAPTATARPGLDPRRILVTAVELIDEHGLRELTMRRLGARLGVEAMALYRHVPGREALLDGVVETVIDDLYGDPLVLLEPRDGWQDYLYRLAHGVRRIALAHPQVFPLVATRPPAAPWVRPPLRSLRWVESLLGALATCGFPDQAAVDAYRAFSSFLLGHLLLEVSARGVDTGPVEEVDPGAPRQTDLSAYPHLQRLQVSLAQDHSAQEFDASLENLLDRLERLLPPSRRLATRETR